MNTIARARLALSTLTVYRGLLENPAVRAYAGLLEALNGPDLRAFADAYGIFYSKLVSYTDDADFGALLGELVQYDDNPFARAAAGRAFEKVAAPLREAAQHDLEALMAAQVTAARLKEWAAENFEESESAPSLIAALPDYQAGKGLPLPGAAEELAAFYRRSGCGLFARYHAFRWQEGGFCAVGHPDPVRLSDLKGYESEREQVVTNTTDFLAGGTACDLLLYGDRGTGKSSTVKAVFNEYRGSGLRIVEIEKERAGDFPRIVEEIRNLPLKFILFIDDLSLSSDDLSFPALKSVLEGGLAVKPKNCLIYATSNRRHLVKENFSGRSGDDIHAADTMQEELSLADRFGMTITFSAPDQKLYFEIVEALADDRGLTATRGELERGAARWALLKGGRSPRAARQYIDWAEGRSGNGLSVTEP